MKKRKYKWEDFEPEVQARMIELYKTNIPYSAIAAELHEDYARVRRVCQRLARNGEVETRTPGFSINTKERLDVMLERAQGLALQRKSTKEIAEELNVKETTVIKYMTILRRNGRIPKTCAPEKHRIIKPTLAEGETVKCTPGSRIRNTCVYGQIDHLQMCKYILYEGHGRTICGGKTGFNPPEACSCYSKVSKNNPRVECREDIGWN